MKNLLKLGMAIVLLSSLPLAAHAQTTIPPVAPRQNGVGNWVDYPTGSQIFRDGSIVTPNSGTVYPTNIIRNGDGSTSYYYSNGTKINVQGNTINPSGSYLSPGINGGLRNDTLMLPNSINNPNLNNNQNNNFNLRSNPNLNNSFGLPGSPTNFTDPFRIR